MTTGKIACSWLRLFIKASHTLFAILIWFIISIFCFALCFSLSLFVLLCFSHPLDHHRTDIASWRCTFSKCLQRTTAKTQYNPNPCGTINWMNEFCAPLTECNACTIHQMDNIGRLNSGGDVCMWPAPIASIWHWFAFILYCLRLFFFIVFSLSLPCYWWWYANSAEMLCIWPTFAHCHLYNTHQNTSFVWLILHAAFIHFQKGRMRLANLYTGGGYIWMMNSNDCNSISERVIFRFHSCHIMSMCQLFSNVSRYKSMISWMNDIWMFEIKIFPFFFCVFCVDPLRFRFKSMHIRPLTNHHCIF